MPRSRPRMEKQSPPSATDAIVAVDENQRITMFDGAAERIFGYRAADIIGKPLDVLIPERFRARHREHIARFGSSADMTGRMGQRSQIAGLRADGREIVLETAIISHSGLSPNKRFVAFLCEIDQRREEGQ